MYHRTNVLCCKERTPQEKKYSNSKVREENIAVVYYSLRATIAALEKFVLVTFYFSLPLVGDGSVGEGWLLTYTCHSRLGRTGRGLGTFDSPVLWSTPSLPSLSGPFWPRVVAPDRVLSMGQIELSRSFKSLLFFAFKLCIYAKLNCSK